MSGSGIIRNTTLLNSGISKFGANEKLINENKTKALRSNKPVRTDHERKTKASACPKIFPFSVAGDASTPAVFNDIRMSPVSAIFGDRLGVMATSLSVLYLTKQDTL